MQNAQFMRELCDEELKGVVGGSSPTFTVTSIAVTASAAGGFFHIDHAFTFAESSSIATGEGVGASLAVGAAVAVAL